MSAALLRVDQLVKRFGGLTATDHAQLTVEVGTVHALIGPNGAGKTTLIQQICGALQPDEGSVWFDGQNVTAMPMDRRARMGLVRSYQVTSIFKPLSVLDNIALPIQARSGSSFRFWRPARAESARYAQAEAQAHRVGLGSRLHSIAASLSHGEQRQLEVALALATQPKLLLLDEPMAGMGQDESRTMLELLQSLRGELTILLVEHDMDVVFRLADTVSTLVFGKVIASGTAQQIRDNPEVQRAYLGDDAVVVA
jgi:branched-chain amino acid transport system ATP-binding protein